MRIGEVDEFGLIQRIHYLTDRALPEGFIGIGDDAAVFPGEPGWCHLLSTDVLVEGVHFKMEWTSPEALGWKAAAVNISDIAAMGGEPRALLVSLALPESWAVARLDEFYQGFQKCCDAFDCVLVGGDMSRSLAGAMISVTVMGRVEEEHLCLRKGARPGDWICVTGSLGGARAGLETVQNASSGFDSAVERFLKPEPRVAQARKWAKTGRVTSMIDISDGLSSELRHLCRASGTGCLLHIDDVPLFDGLADFCAVQQEDRAAFILGSGEEYELLFTLSPSTDMDLGPHVTQIGEMRPAGDGMRMEDARGRHPLMATGWNHFQ